MECTEMQLDHISQLATMKNKINNLETAVHDLSSIKETLVELKIISKQNVDFNQTQLKSNKEVEIILMKINDNLSQLNSRVKIIEEKDIIQDASATEVRVEDKRVSAERYKAKFTFFGVIFASAMSVLGIIIALILE